MVAATRLVTALNHSGGTVPNSAVGTRVTAVLSAMGTGVALLVVMGSGGRGSGRSPLAPQCTEEASGGSAGSCATISVAVTAVG